MNAINHTACKARAKAVMNETSPTIFMAALIGVGIPILIGWLTSGTDGSGIKLNFNLDSASLDLHNIGTFVRSAWGQATAMLGAAIVSMMAIWAMLIGLIMGCAEAILNYGFTDYTLRTVRGDLGEPKNVLIGFRIPGRIIIAHILRGIVVWAGLVCFIIPGIIAAYSLRMTERVMIDHPEWTVVQCMQHSRALMRGHRMDLFGLDLSFFGWIILEGLTKELSGIYSRTYRTLAESFFYEDLCMDIYEI